METGHFYFLKDTYFKDFPDPHLSQNKEESAGVLHDRPCFYSFIDITTQIYWMIPFTSKIIKFRKIYQDKIIRYGKCDTIVFGFVLGYEKAFLLQNMCPAIDKYINNEYLDKRFNVPVKVDGVLEKEIIQKSKIILALARQGKKVIFPDVLKIEKELKKQIT